MNQLERDYTYRLDLVKAICEQHGYESQDCQQSMEIWQIQHNLNVMFHYASQTFWFFLLGLFLFWIYTKAVVNKLKNLASENEAKKED